MILEDKLKGIRKWNSTMLKGDELLLEYAVDFANSKINVIVIGSENPQKMLRF